MGRNLTLSEYEALLRTSCERFGCTERSLEWEGSRTLAPRWESIGRLMTCSISLDNSGDELRALIPRLRIDSSSTVPDDPLLAITLLQDAQETILRASKAFALLGSPVVWIRDCPCSYCNGSGTEYKSKSTCTHCNGAGVRNDPKKVT